MPQDNEQLQERIDALEREVAELKQRGTWRGVRRRSDIEICGLPLYVIATGPDPEQNEIRGHARGIIAIGDIATGVVAIGGFARGIVAIGGLGVGVVAFGGGAIGLLGAIGGLAIGAFAGGGCAVGFVAIGSVAIGYYACGAVALGKHVIDVVQQDPAAVRFFGPVIPKWLGL
ncbi:MAG: hypothetical protein U0992_20290 [Planctomycetaceae bacterium]